MTPMIAMIALTDGVAKAAAGSLLLTALLLGLGIFGIRSTATWFKALSVLVAAAVVVFAMLLFSADQKSKTDTASRDMARRCESLLATVKQGLKDKLLLEKDLPRAKNIARSLIRDIEASKCRAE